jgi:hypothetical protein
MRTKTIAVILALLFIIVAIAPVLAAIQPAVQPVKQSGTPFIKAAPAGLILTEQCNIGYIDPRTGAEYCCVQWRNPRTGETGITCHKI